MALVPEFFTLLGIEILLAISMLSALLDRYLPSRLQYIFQISAAIGFGQLLLSLGFVGGQMPPYQARFWASLVFLGFALSSVVGTNAYLMVVRRSMMIAPAFSSAVTVPFLLVSALFISSFLGSRDVTFSPSAIVTLAVLLFVASFGTFGFFREFAKRFGTIQGGLATSAITSISTLPGERLTSNLSSVKGEVWEESPEEKEGE